MLLRSPAEYYIRALILDPAQYSTKDIWERLLEDRCDAISVRYIDSLRKTLKPPDPFYPEDAGHAPSLKFILDEQVYRYFQPNDAMRQALTILKRPRAREFVESMLTSFAVPSAIAQYITNYRKVYCTAAGIECYQHYFWEVELLDATQMRLLTRYRVDFLADNVPELKDKKKMLEQVYYKDARKLAAELPHSPTAAMLTQSRMGAVPEKANLSIALMESRHAMVLRALESSQQDGLQESQKCLNYTNSARMMSELIDTVAKPSDGIADSISKIGLRTEQATVVAIGELSGGNHTVDMVPLEDKDDKPAAIAAAEAGRGPE